MNTIKKLLENECRIYEVLNFLSYKWNTFIILKLSENPSSTITFTEIKKELKTITSKALSTRLKDLEENKVISKTVITLKNKKEIYYKLTKEGLELLPILLVLRDWGKTIAPCKIEKECNKCDFISNCYIKNKLK